MLPRPAELDDLGGSVEGFEAALRESLAGSASLNGREPPALG